MKESGLPPVSAAGKEARDALTTSRTNFTQLDPTNSQVSAADDLPSVVGRYRVEKELGRGAFGRVLLAHDDELQRKVAIKIPHRTRLLQPGAADTYLAEARSVACLDHPGIVPVYDVGITADGLPFVVSKYLEGGDLAERMKGEPFTPAETAALVASVAESLHFAHGKGIVHRDLKPGNILLDAHGRPFLGDFGLALREEDFGKGQGYAGTPCYMSPEQARGQGHRVDGRSDIFSLGIIFYELLTGRRPFRSDSTAELLDHIVQVEARPPRQINDAIPSEYERICLKALAKKPAERYTTAKDFCADLRRQGGQSLALVQNEAPLATRDHREAKLESGVQVGNMGCSLRVAVTLVVLLLIGVAAVSTHPDVRSLLSRHVAVPRHPFDVDGALVALRTSLQTEDLVAAEDILSRLKAESPANYESQKVQQLVSQLQQIKIRIAVRDEAFHLVQVALQQGSVDELKKARLAIDNSILAQLTERERQDLQELLNQVVAAIERQQNADEEFKRGLNSLAKNFGSSLDLDQNQVMLLSKQIHELDQLKGVSSATKQPISSELTILANSKTNEGKRLALRELLAINRINQAVGRTPEYERALEDYVTAFSGLPRAAAFKETVTDIRRKSELVDRYNRQLAGSRYVAVGWLRLDDRNQWIGSITNSKSMAAGSFKLYLFIQTNDEIEPREVGAYQNGQARLDDATRSLWTEGLVLYAVETDE